MSFKAYTDWMTKDLVYKFAEDVLSETHGYALSGAGHELVNRGCSVLDTIASMLSWETSIRNEECDRCWKLIFSKIAEKRKLQNSPNYSSPLSDWINWARKFN